MRQPSIALITFSWRMTDMALVGVTPSRAVVAEDVRDLQRRTGHVPPATSAARRSWASDGVSRSSGLGTSRRILLATCV